MKKIILTLCLVLFVSSAYAGSCPMLAKNIEDKIKKAQELKDQGMDAHNNGDHAKSEKLLSEAIKGSFSLDLKFALRDDIQHRHHSDGFTLVTPYHFIEYRGKQMYIELSKILQDERSMTFNEVLDQILKCSPNDNINTDQLYLRSLFDRGLINEVYSN